MEKTISGVRLTVVDVDQFDDIAPVVVSQARNALVLTLDEARDLAETILAELGD